MFEHPAMSVQIRAGLQPHHPVFVVASHQLDQIACLNKSQTASSNYPIVT
jgi:hypothetical protein